MIEKLRSPDGQKLLRYSAVSLISLAVSTAVLTFCSGVLRWSPVESSTMGTAVSTIPSYQLNRKWAWGKSGRSHLGKEVTPFWVLSFVGYFFSTISVHFAAKVANANHFSHLEHTAFLAFTYVAAYGVLWIGKFIIFNRVLFAHRPVPNEAFDGRTGLPT